MSRQHLRPPDPHPALVQHARERAALVQNRIADDAPTPGEPSTS